LETLHEPDQIQVFVEQYNDLMKKKFYLRHLSIPMYGLTSKTFAESLNLLDEQYMNNCIIFRSNYLPMLKDSDFSHLVNNIHYNDR